MTGLRFFSRTSWLWLDGAAVFIAAAFLACGGPVPITGSSSLTGGSGGGKSTGTSFGLDTKPSTNTSTGTDTGIAVSSADGGNCGITTAPLNKQPADLLLVLDKTGSLMNAMDGTGQCAAGSTTCQQRWATLVSGLNAVLTSSSTDVNWGLETFNSTGSCTVDPPEVPIAPGSAAAVQTFIAGITPNGNTPTRLAIDTAVTYLKTLTDPNPKYILLATDGEPNCGAGGRGGGGTGATDITATQNSIQLAFNAGYKVYVLGVGPETTNLNALAVAGGTIQYYPALTPQALTDALATIVGSVVSCTFGLGTAPQVPTNVAVQFNNDPGIRAPRDISHTNGWDYTTPANTSIQLYGSWCDDVTSGKYTNAQILKGCPGGEAVQK
jgi:hypothetical protein